MVGGGGSTAEQRRWRFASKSGELEPARRGLAAPLEVEEGMQMLIPGNAGTEGARRRGAERRRRWRRRRSRERRRRHTREPRWGLYRPIALAGKEVRPGGVRDRGWRGRPARWRRWTTGRAAWLRSRRLSRVSARGKARGHAWWPAQRPSGPLGRVRAVDEVHRRRTTPERGGGAKTGHRGLFAISDFPRDLFVIKNFLLFTSLK